MALVDIISHYLTLRQSSVLKLIPGNVDIKNYFNKQWSILTSKTISFKILQADNGFQFTGIVKIINTFMFLRQGLYPSVPLMMLNIKPVSTIDTPRTVGYSYVTR